jgi:YfiH family protein
MKGSCGRAISATVIPRSEREVTAHDLSRASLLEAKALSLAGFAHGFTTRIGGVSAAPYDAFDFALRRDPRALEENTARLARALGIAPGALHQVTQVHGAAVVVADGAPRAMEAVEADALVAEPGTGHAVGVRVADCVPVLLADPASGRVAAVHAGWRGIESAILSAAIRRVVGSPGSGPVNGFVAAIGPCIGPCCFEVGLDVAERIVQATDAGVVARIAQAEEKAYVDLRRAVRIQLVALGLADGSVDDVPGRGPEGCTRCDATRFYSYRRDADASGRLIGVVVAR